MRRQTPSVDEKKDAVRRVLESRHFRKAPRLRDFLQFVAAHALDGRTDELHEADIGRAVYERPSDYTPAEDSIVRVEARNLRRKLAAYYQSEGANDPVVITIPKGTYVPKFTVRDSSAPDGRRRSRAKGARLSVILACALLASLGGNLWLVLSRPPSPANSASGISEPTPQHLLWSALFRPEQETYIVVADSVYALVQDLLGRTFTLRDYRRPDFLLTDAVKGFGEPYRSVAEAIYWRQYTSLADAILVAKIMRVPAAARSQPSIRFARNMHPRDFKGRNVILLGSARSNPWCDLFEPRLNFKFEYDYQARKPYIRNKAPRGDEPATYVPRSSGEGLDETYAVISFIPNLTEDGYVLMIAGTSMEGTEAAGELLLNQAETSDIIWRLGLESDGRIRPFEVLLKSSRMEGAPVRTVVITHRLFEDR